MRISTWGSVNARKPRSCNSRLPAGKGYGVASAMRFSWTRPPQVALRKRIVSRAFTSRTFLTVWSFVLPLEHSPVQQGLGGGRYAVRCRHGHKGGRRRGSGTGDHGRWRLLQRYDHGGCLSLRDAEPLGQGGQGAGTN